jgi:hypothetical protein
VEEVTVKQEENNFFCCDLFYSRSLYLQVGWCCRKLLNAMFLCLANPKKCSCPPFHHYTLLYIITIVQKKLAVNQSNKERYGNASLFRSCGYVTLCKSAGVFPYLFHPN